MLTAQYTRTEVRRQEPDPDAWAIRDIGTLAQARALHNAGCRVGKHVLSRRCAQCGAWGDVLVSDPDEVTDAIEFITRDGWRCNTCRRADTAHFVPSPKPTPDSRAATPAGNGGRGRRSKRSPARPRRTRQAEAVRKAWWLYHDACDTLDAIDAGDVPASARDNTQRQLTAAWHALVRLGAVNPAEVA